MPSGERKLAVARAEDRGDAAAVIGGDERVGRARDHDRRDPTGALVQVADPDQLSPLGEPAAIIQPARIDPQEVRERPDQDDERDDEQGAHCIPPPH